MSGGSVAASLSVTVSSQRASSPAARVRWSGRLRNARSTPAAGWGSSPVLADIARIARSRPARASQGENATNLADGAEDGVRLNAPGGLTRTSAAGAPGEGAGDNGARRR